MKYKHLYFICPTDYLELVIEDNFPTENYFFTSLGNSIAFNRMTMEQINAMIEVRGIKKITFVLADDNRFILDGLVNNKLFDSIPMRQFYKAVSIQKTLSEKIWKTDGLRIPIISHYLEKRINELIPQLNHWLLGKMDICAKVYNRKNNTFRELHFSFFHEENLSLN